MVNRLFGQPEGPDRAMSREPPKSQQLSSPPLTAEELDTLRTAYLQRLQQQYVSLHLYGLDARRRALQESGEVLDLRALYTPLNTTRLVSTEQAPGPTRDALPLPARTAPVRPLSLLEAVGNERKTVIRGPHGSGKSTFLRFVALCLAAECMDDHEEMARLQPAWKHGTVFPLLIDLRQVALSPHHDGTADGLCGYLADDLDIYPDQLEDQLIRPGGMVFLLDGIEAAPAAVASFARRYDATDNLFFLTCQEHVDLADARFSTLHSFTPVALGPWTTDDTDKFAQKWYAELERKGWIDAESARDLPGQLRSALRRNEVAVLARRPSLMTLIALLQTMRGSFPADRVTFYHELIDRAITYWSEGGFAGERDLRQAFDKDDLRAAVAQVAYQAHTRLEKATCGRHWSACVAKDGGMQSTTWWNVFSLAHSFWRRRLRAYSPFPISPCRHTLPLVTWLQSQSSLNWSSAWPKRNSTNGATSFALPSLDWPSWTTGWPRHWRRSMPCVRVPCPMQIKYHIANGVFPGSREKRYWRQAKSVCCQGHLPLKGQGGSAQARSLRLLRLPVSRTH
jgi:hypothetical protein